MTIRPSFDTGRHSPQAQRSGVPVDSDFNWEGVANELALTYPKKSRQQIADMVMRQMNPHQVHLMARVLLEDRVFNIRRKRVQQIEHEADPLVPSPKKKRRVKEIMSTARRQYWDGIDARIKKAHEALSLVEGLEAIGVTTDLLEATFFLGDGTEVTWGAATAEQHATRIELLMSKASGTMETASRHVAAIRMIEDNNVKCLNDLEPR
jgi:hypothetical protein